MIRLRIVGHPFSVEGRTAEDFIRRTEGFRPFARPETESDSPLFSFRLLENTVWATPVTHLHTFETEGITCFFFRTAHGYGFSMDRRDGQGPFTWEYLPALRTVTAAGPTDEARMRFSLWMAFGTVALEHSTIALHCSTIRLGRQAVLFLGESGTGKSTHTQLWQENIPGAELLNDDSPFLRIENGQAFVYGSPWSGKTPCYRDESAVVAAVVRLSQAPENRIRRLGTAEALGALLPSCPPSFAYDEALADREMAILSPLIQNVPVYHLECRPDAQAALMSHSTVFGKNEK